jgi:predicted ATP-grasp superfamily ATP-dependent carboligase
MTAEEQIKMINLELKVARIEKKDLEDKIRKLSEQLKQIKSKSKTK